MQCDKNQVIIICLVRKVFFHVCSLRFHSLFFFSNKVVNGDVSELNSVKVLSSQRNARLQSTSTPLDNSNSFSILTKEFLNRPDNVTNPIGGDDKINNNNPSNSRNLAPFPMLRINGVDVNGLAENDDSDEQSQGYVYDKPKIPFEAEDRESTNIQSTTVEPQRWDWNLSILSFFRLGNRLVIISFLDFCFMAPIHGPVRRNHMTVHRAIRIRDQKYLSHCHRILPTPMWRRCQVYQPDRLMVKTNNPATISDYIFSNFKNSVSSKYFQIMLYFLFFSMLNSIAI